MEDKGRILLGKPGLDGHDRGVMVIATAFRDAGYEVIYTGIRCTPEEIVKTALEEDVDVLGLSNLSGAHLTLFTKVANLIQKEVGKEILMICGGTIPVEDIPALKEVGFAEVFTSGTSVTKIIQFVGEKLKERKLLDDE